MDSFFSSINDSARKLWSKVSGRTANLNALAAYAQTLGKLPSARVAGSASLASVFPWHHVGSGSANLMVWQPDGDGGMQAVPQNPETFSVTREERISHVELSIREVQGLSASKSPIEDYFDLDDFAKERCSDLMTDISAGGARALLSKGNVRLWVDGKEPKAAPDNFVWHQWDERLYFSNCDGSHHFAAARRIAHETQTDIKVGASLTMHTIDMATVINLVNRFDIFFVGMEAPEGEAYGQGRCRAPDLELHEHMKRLQATWAYLSLPWSAPDGYLLILPKHLERSREVGQLLRDAGLTDAGHLLSVAALNQVPFFPSSHAQAA